MSSSSSSSIGSVGVPCFDDELVSQGNVIIQNDVVSPTLNTNEASLGIATVGIAFHLDPSQY